MDFEHPTCKGRSYIYFQDRMLLPLQGVNTMAIRNPGCRFACPGLCAVALSGRALSAVPQNQPLYICHTHNVGKDTGCGDSSTCAITLDEHGIFVVALGGQQNDIVRTFEVVERMALRYFTQAYTAFTVSPFCHKTPSFVFARQSLTFSFKLGIE